LATVISLALLFLGLLIKPWTLVLVLVVAFGGPLVGRLESLATSPVSNWRRSQWTGLALLLAAALLALTGSSGGQGALILALLPVAWVLVTDRSILQGSKEDERASVREPLTISRAADEDESSSQAEAKLDREAAAAEPPERLVGGELLAKIKELGDVGKSDLVRACGYFSQKSDGSERLNFTEFYEALLQAKGIGSLNGGAEEDKPEAETELDATQPVNINSRRSSSSNQKANKVQESVPNVIDIKSISGPFSVNVSKSEISEPDDDGDMSVSLRLALASEAYEDVELVLSKLIVLNSAGLPLLDREDEHEALITSGSTEDIELYSGYFKEDLLGSSSTSETQVLVQLTPCGCRYSELQPIAVPPSGNISGITESLPIIPDVSLQGLSVFTAQPDEDGECSLEFKGLIVNESHMSINKLEVTIALADRNGREIETTDWSDKIAPHSTFGFDRSLWGIKSSKLTEAKATLRIKAFYSLGNYEMSWPIGSPPAHSLHSIKDSSSEQSAKQQESPSPAQNGDRASDLPANSTREQDAEAFAVEIKNATYTPPDEDGDTQYEVQYSLSNRSESPIELILSRLFVLHPSGLLVATTDDETEDMADVGESIHATISTWRAPSRDLDGAPGSAQLLLQISACSCSYQDLGSVACPEQGRYVTLKPEPTTNGALQVEAITVSTDPPDDGESRIHIKALIRNNSDAAIPKLALETKLISASGRELEETSSQEEAEANGTVLIEDSFWGIKESRLTSSRIQFALKAFSALGTSKTLTTNPSEGN